MIHDEPAIVPTATTADGHAHDISARVRAADLVMDEMMVPSFDPGIEIYVRNKRPASMATFSPERTVVFVHGATVPASTCFDLQLDGLSWMEYIAARGFDVYLLDLRGYGRSTRPPEMAAAPGANVPIVRSETAVKDIGSVVDFVLARRGIPRVNLIGWSWGTALMALYTSRNTSKVERLTLFAPGWLRNTPSLARGDPDPLGAYRIVTREQVRERWLTGVPEHAKATLIPPGWFDAWADATWATDPVGAQQTPPVIRAPNGVLQDGVEYWQAGRPLYDPSAITVPTLLVVGEWDHDTPPSLAQTLFPLLVNAPGKRLVELAEGTHIIVMEKNRLALFETVQEFLEADRVVV
jgi:pimeloyl-ACP methyl ester carboxylesterase